MKKKEEKKKTWKKCPTSIRRPNAWRRFWKDDHVGCASYAFECVRLAPWCRPPAPTSCRKRSCGHPDFVSLKKFVKWLCWYYILNFAERKTFQIFGDLSYNSKIWLLGLTRMAFFSCSASARNWSSSFMMTLDLKGRRGRGPEIKVGIFFYFNVLLLLRQ